MRERPVRLFVSPRFKKYIDETSEETGITRIKITEKLVENDIINSEKRLRELLGVFYVPRIKKK